MQRSVCGQAVAVTLWTGLYRQVRAPPLSHDTCLFGQLIMRGIVPLHGRARGWAVRVAPRRNCADVGGPRV